MRTISVRGDCTCIITYWSRDQCVKVKVNELSNDWQLTVTHLSHVDTECSWVNAAKQQLNNCIRPSQFLISYNYYSTLHPFNGLFSRTNWVSRHQKGKPLWILLKQEMMGWQWHQLDHIQIICTSLQTDSHATTVFYRLDALPAAQPTALKHWGHSSSYN